MWLAPDSRRLSCAHKRVCRHTVLIFDQPGTDLPVPQLRAENVAGSIVVLHSNIRRTGSLAGMRSQPSLTLSVCCNTKRHTYYCSSPLFPPPRLQIPPEECNQPVLHLPFADCFVSSAYHSLNPPASHLPTLPPPPPPQAFKSRQSQETVTSLCYAAKRGDIVELYRLAAGGFDLNMADYDGRTPLVRRSPRFQERGRSLKSSLKALKAG